MGEPGTNDRIVVLSLLGQFRLARGQRELQVPPSVQRLLAYLAIREHPLSRRMLAAALWPDVDESHAAASLRSALHRERQLSGLVDEASRGHLELSGVVVVDLRQMRELARRTIRARQRGVRHLDPGDGWSVLLSTELLPDWDELWLVHERERLRLLCLHALEQRARWFIEQGQLAEAIETAQVAVEMEELRESAHRVLIQAHVEEGNYAAAIEQYRRFCDRLDAELGIEPSPMLDELMTSITRA